jgi:hypothetical protein
MLGLRLSTVLVVAALSACAGHQRLASVSACSPADTSASDVVRVVSAITSDPQAANQLQIPEFGSGTVGRITSSELCAAALEVYRTRCGVTIARVDRIQVARVGQLFVVVAPTIMKSNPEGLVYHVFDEQWQFRGCFSPTRLRRSPALGSLTRVGAGKGEIMDGGLRPLSI